MAEIDEKSKEGSSGKSFGGEKPAHRLDPVLLTTSRRFILVTTGRGCGFPQERGEGTTFTRRTFGAVRIRLCLWYYFKAALCLWDQDHDKSTPFTESPKHCLWGKDTASNLRDRNSSFQIRYRLDFTHTHTRICTHTNTH